VTGPALAAIKYRRSTIRAEINMSQPQQQKSASHATEADMDEPQGNPSVTRDTKQKGLDAQEKRKHEKSENELPSAQEKNPVPPGSTRK
jgi:outer membrane translocation and assembly module TamA